MEARCKKKKTLLICPENHYNLYTLPASMGTPMEGNYNKIQKGRGETDLWTHVANHRTCLLRHDLSSISQQQRILGKQVSCSRMSERSKIIQHPPVTLSKTQMFPSWFWTITPHMGDHWDQEWVSKTPDPHWFAENWGWGWAAGHAPWRRWE